MKKLSICIPTYNRPDSIDSLSKDFFSPILDKYSEMIEIIVCDNSDEYECLLNERFLDSRVKYDKNLVNLGFAGNIKKCIELATGEFLWIIADDDEIIIEKFELLIDALNSSDFKEISVFIIGTETKNIEGNTFIVNTSFDWDCNRICCVEHLLKSGNIPFLFLGSGVIRNNFEIIDSDFIDNDYIQSLYYLSILKNESKVCFLDEAVVKYNSDANEVRFSILSISDSIQKLISYIYDNFKIKLDKKKFHEEHLKWMLMYKLGITKVKNGKKDTYAMILKIFSMFNFKNFFFTTLLLFPSKLLQIIFNFYRVFKKFR